MGKTVLPNPRTTPRFAGISTFCRYPRVEDVLPENRPLDWILYGAPFDSGVTYRAGARFGPRAIRDASQYVKRFHIVHEVDVCDALSIADAGDAPVQPYDLEANAQAMAHWAAGQPDNAKLFAVGGDHSIAYANLLATWQRRGKPSSGLALVHFDSHLDTVDEVWGNKWGHASPFIRAIEAGIVDPKAMISVGIKGPLNRRDDLDFARKHGVTILTHDTAVSTGTHELQSFVSRHAARELYITFDIDVLDPAFAPGTGTPCPGGLTTGQAFDLLRALRGASICGGDVVEVLPDRDIAGNTALAAAHVMFEVIALSATS